ncbi:hypothetical protein KJ603_02330 [Patescibacteria group bacterium]|nr:hypothetical protein [Patescibacteria group bacterium]
MKHRLSEKLGHLEFFLFQKKKSLTLVSNFFDLDEYSVLQTGHSKDVVRARQMVILIFKERLEISFSEIGKILNGRASQTIGASYKEAKRREQEESSFSIDIEEIRNLL